VGHDGVGVVGLVRHEDDWTIGLRGEGEIEVGIALAGIIDAAEPETSSIALYWEVSVDEDGCATAGERLDHHRGVDGYIVITEDGIAQRGGECGNDLGASVCGVFAGDEGDRAVSDEVAGKEHDVGIQGVDLADDALEKERFGVLVEVDVAELNDAVAVEGGGEIRDGDGAVDDVHFVASDLSGVKSQSRGGSPAAYEEVASSKARRLNGLRAGHTP